MHTVWSLMHTSYIRDSLDWFSSQDSPIEVYHAQTFEDGRESIDRLEQRC